MERNYGRLKDFFKKNSLKVSESHAIVLAGGSKATWIFDLKSALLNPQVLNDIVGIFWDKFEKEYPFQIGGMETASIPLIGAIVADSQKRGTPVTGFYMRKSRNKTGLQKRIEGTVSDEKIILIDDIINSGKSLNAQIEVLSNEKGKGISGVFSIMCYRDKSCYSFLKEKNIELKNIFNLGDFDMPAIADKNDVARQYYSQLWYFRSNGADFFNVVPKSTPAIDSDNIYFGTDNGTFWALNQRSGDVVWRYQIYSFRSKGIFSSSALHDGKVYFGAYDGNMYCLDAKTGRRIWMFSEADWVGSSPAIANDIGLVFVGLEFGLFKRQGGIAALDLKTGKKKWEFAMDKMTHSSPLYIQKKNLVIIGNNNGSVYAFNAKNGKLRWTCKTKGDIKDSFVFDSKRGWILFGSMDGNVYAADAKDGTVQFSFKGGFGVYSTPCLHENCVIFSCLDKYIYCVDLDRKSLRWKFATSGRCFPRPVIVDGNVFAGSNDGRLYEIDFVTGGMRSFFQAAERITNEAVYNDKTGRFFVLTHANEIFCLARQSMSHAFGLLPPK